jgi:CBS domain-containing protein
MVSPVISVSSDTPLIKLEEMFVGLYIRHLLIRKDDKPVGLLSIGDVMRASLLNQDQKIKELNRMVSWEYYENWGWKGNEKKNKK